MNKYYFSLNHSVYEKSSKWVTHSQVERSVNTECGLLGWEGFTGPQDVILVPRAGLLVADVAQRLLAAQCRVVWLTDRQEVGGEVTCHYLACVDKDVNREEAKGVDSCEEKKKDVKSEVEIIINNEMPHHKQYLLISWTILWSA